MSDDTASDGGLAEGPMGADRAAFGRLARHRLPRWVELAARASTSPHARLPVAAAVLATVHRTRGRRAAVVPVAATLLASAVANGPLKHAVRRARPDRTVVPPQRRTGEREDTPSFPSSHAATAFAFASATTVLVPPLAIVTLPAAVAVSASRVVVGDHYPMDVVVGALLGVAVGGGASRATERRGWV